ncbi:glycoside hydrolase family 125 protein [Aulographum hederae CBS 113979]|uniref:Glycoside hydrolase family 125 protein n=1 Tax=Aulographum hederae CBS 113979 TaxID=1176131 RepID=A0A6G1H323_9PEZI|nr:glycoside hydrolase family 125 protein [Aulographum hederae CBS 113979]
MLAYTALPPLLLLLSPLLQTTHAQFCPDYLGVANTTHEPFSTGKYALSSQRPIAACRTFNSSQVEALLARYTTTISDPDLLRLFTNSYPNTLDTAIKWRGVSATNPAEELTFIITGDIDAMWLRDSSNQVQSYLPLLTASNASYSLASLYRGVINLQARYLLTSPYCNSFQPPVESGLPPAENGAASNDVVTPVYSNTSVFECKYELDSLAAFLEVSANYHNATGDTTFFSRFSWSEAVEAILTVAEEMQTPTYGADGAVLKSPYTFTRETTRSTETFANDGLGNPVASGTGLIRSGFRPSDDSTIYQLFVPANMMFSSYLSQCVPIARGIGKADLAERMESLAASVRKGIEEHGVVDTLQHGRVYAFEVDGYGGQTIMDDANIPSLLSAPFLGYVDQADEVYQATRKMVLGSGNPYFMRGPVINAIGGPHQGPGMAWPMAKIVQILTTDDEAEIVGALKEILSSTDRLGLIHESINSFNASDWTRQWFSWANGLFGQMILNLYDRKPEILRMSFQD